jgi:hypothetical protein
MIQKTRENIINKIIDYCSIKEKQSTASKCVYPTLFSHEVRTTGFGLYIRQSSGSTSIIDIRTLLVREGLLLLFICIYITK